MVDPDGVPSLGSNVRHLRVGDSNLLRSGNLGLRGPDPELTRTPTPYPTRALGVRPDSPRILSVVQKPGVPGTAIVTVGGDLSHVEHRWWSHDGYTPIEACYPHVERRRRGTDGQVLVDGQPCDLHEGPQDHTVPYRRENPPGHLGHWGHEDWDRVRYWDGRTFDIVGLEYIDVPYDPAFPGVRLTKQLVAKEPRTVNLQLRSRGPNGYWSDPSRVAIFRIWGGGCGNDDLKFPIPVDICLDEEVYTWFWGESVYAGVYSSNLDEVVYDLDGVHDPPGGVRHRHSSGAATYPVGPADEPVVWDGTPIPPESIPTKPAPPPVPVVLEAFQVEGVAGTVGVRMEVGGDEWQYSLEHRWWVDGDERSIWVTTAILSGDIFLVTHWAPVEPGASIRLADGLPRGDSIWVNIETRARSVPEGLASGPTGVLRVEVQGGGAEWANP